MQHKSFDTVYFWRNFMEKSKYSWERVLDERMTERSVFGHFVIVNCYGGEFLNNWISFPNSKALLGFLKYVFLPTAYVEWFDREDSDGFISIEADPAAWIDLLKASKKERYHKEIPVMEKELFKIESLWPLEEADCMAELKKFAEQFTEQWTKSHDVFFQLQVFQSPEEVGQYLIDVYEEDQLTERIKEQLNVSKEELKEMTAQMHGNEFMKRKFMDLLNNCVVDLV